VKTVKSPTILRKCRFSHI